MSVEKYINENGQEVTILHNGDKEFDDFMSQFHAPDYSHIVLDEKCPFNKDNYAKKLGLIRNKDCENTEYL